MAEIRAHQGLIEALSQTNPTLARRMQDCGRDDKWAGNIFTCRTTGCPPCKARYMRSQQRKVVQVLGSADKANLSFVTINFDITGPIDGIEEIWKKGKRDLRNRVKACARENGRWKSVQLCGWVEADPVTYDMVPLLGDKQQSFIRAHNPILGETPQWSVHMHGFIHHPQMDWQAVRDGLKEQWPIDHAVDVRSCNQPGYHWQATHQALAYMTRYSVKFRAGRLLGNAAWGSESYAVDYWPASWLADYHTQLAEMSRGHQGTRVTIGFPKSIANAGRKVVNDSCEKNGKFVDCYGSINHST